MRNISKLFKDELNKDNRKYLSVIDITLKDGTVLNVRDDSIMDNGLKIEDATSNSNSFDISSVIINKATIVLNNIYETYTNYDFDGAKVSIKIGLQLSDKNTEYVDFGLFLINDTRYNGSIITLECFDYISKFDKPYKESKLNYPATLGEIVRNACSVCDVQVGFASFYHDDYVIKQRPNDDSLTFRQVLLWVGQIACVWWKCNAKGQLTHGWYDRFAFAGMENTFDGGVFDSGTPKYDSGDTLDGGNLKVYQERQDRYTGGSFSDKKNYHFIEHYTSQNIATDEVKITGIEVVAGNDNKETYLYGSKGYVIKITGNKFINAENKVEIASFIAEKSVGLLFRPLSINCLSNPSIEAGDAIVIIDRKQRYYFTYATNVTFESRSYQKVSCGAKSAERQRHQVYSSADQLYSELHQQIVNEQTEREVAVEALNQTLANASGMYVTEELQSDGSTITYLHDKPTLKESKNVIKITGEAIGISNDGGATYPYGLFLNGDLIARLLYVVGINADYIKTGAFVVEKDGQVVFRADKDTGRVDIVADSFSMAGRSIDEIAKDQVDKLTIGTRNLLKTTIRNGNNCEVLGDSSVKVGIGVANDTYFTLYTHQHLNTNELYTLSFDVENVPSDFNWEFYIQDTKWKVVLDHNGRVFATGNFARDVVANGGFYFDDFFGKGPNRALNIVLSKFKLEKGDKATDYTLAPEDVEAYTDKVVQDLDNKLKDSQEIFDRLTDNSRIKGLFMENGRLYVNASYVKTGVLTLGGKYNQKGELQIRDSSDNVIGTWNNNGIDIRKGSIYCKTKYTGASLHGGRMNLTYGDTDVGYVGTNYINNFPNEKGIVFDLEYSGSYMSWAYEETQDSTMYTMVWTYSRNQVGVFSGNMLNAGCDIDMHNHTIHNLKVDNLQVGGYLAWTGEIPIVTKYENGQYWQSTISVENGIIMSAPTKAKLVEVV